MKYLLSIILLISLTARAQENIQFPSITLVNSIEYIDTSFKDNHPGCGFLIDIGDEILAVTCKHVLWENKPLNVSTVNINDQITSWKMFVRNDQSQYVVLDKLINNNPSEKIGEWNTDKDYLVFTVKENHSNVKALKLASERAHSNDTIYKIGWSFKDKEVPQQTYISKIHKYLGPSILIQDLIRSFQAGTSGSPVINKKQELLGIVSTWKYDNETQAWYGAPCSTDYLWEIIYQHWLQKNNQQKSFNSFNSFVDDYKKTNNSGLVISTNLLTNLFFDNWLRNNNKEIGTIADFEIFKNTAENKLNIKLENDSYIINNLHFNEWEISYLKNESSIEYLKQKELKFTCDFMTLSMFALELINSDQLEKALELMKFTVTKFSNNGQVYAFLADVYSAKGETEKARINYEKCLQYYPGYPYAKNKLKDLMK
ncbi:MAG: trypsin-like peptidase domain-containing protein [Bacteroidales bacterium]|nr:trypsin-like peptidase domain-containing protein [Bacteroidales bacterium]